MVNYVLSGVMNSWPSQLVNVGVWVHLLILFIITMNFRIMNHFVQALEMA